MSTIFNKNLESGFIQCSDLGVKIIEFLKFDNALFAYLNITFESLVTHKNRLNVVWLINWGKFSVYGRYYYPIHL